MIGVLVITVLGTSAGGGPAVEHILAAWTKRDVELAAADLSWEIVRDSRTADFGFWNRPTDAETWRLRIADAQWRVDGHRLTVVGQDKRPRPAVADPARARLEFHQVLLEKRLEGEQRVPRRESVAVVFSKQLVGTNSSFGDLAELLTDAPILAMRPLILIEPSQIAVTDRLAHFLGRQYPIIEQRKAADVTREFWIDPDHGFRIVRMIEVEHDRVVAQIDLSYSGENGLPAGWTVLLLNGEENVVDFAQAEVAKLQINPSLANEVFNVPTHLAAEDYHVSLGSYSTIRPHLRSMIDSVWLLGALPGIVAVWALTRWRRIGPSTPGATSTLARTLLIAVVVFGGLLLLQHTPILDPSISESHQRLTAIWRKVQSQRHRSPGQIEWDPIAEKALVKLENISGEIEQCLSRTRHGVWPLLVGRDQAAERARLDLIGVAKHDLPEILRLRPSEDDAREQSVARRLGKVRDHIAGVSPYILAAGNSTSAARWKTPNVVSLAGSVCGVVLVIWGCLWAKRGKERGRLSQPETMPNR